MSNVCPPADGPGISLASSDPERVFHNYSATDDRKVFCSRVPPKFDNEKLKSLLETQFSVTVEEVALQEDEEEKDEPSAPRSAEVGEWAKKKNKLPEKPHLGYGFVLLSSEEDAQILLDAGSCKAGKKHTVVMRPIQRTSGDNVGSNVCYLWSKGRCTHGEMCKFVHEGEGACLEKGDGKKKCFDWMKLGKCKKGDACQFKHDEADRGSKMKKRKLGEAEEGAEGAKAKLSNAEKDCNNWKSKGKCRKGDKCPYKHDPEVQRKALAKKKKKQAAAGGGDGCGGGEMLPPENDSSCTCIKFENYTMEDVKRSKVEKVLKEAQCPKPKRVKVADDGASFTCSFGNVEKATDAMIIMNNFKDLFGGAAVALTYVA
ncbi:hypothetical protein TrST_g221 [Triparma strigata]|uniref:C3H1-type domain-containing protein n=1 Tax=Triparma strigata TaxID=1606541 RepID=A0A9W7ACH5_9STRA|nr:hypothetical protein TrST_g221 [Triparma strigata]